MKHILAKHDGEARIVGDAKWVPFPASGGDVHQACFWHYQFATRPETRRYLYWRSQDSRSQDSPVSDEEIEWILNIEGNETALMKFCYGGWRFKEGNFITLAELFSRGMKTCSCFDMYRTYLSLPIFIHKKVHSFSQSEGANKRRNAKKLHHQESGRWGLPSRPGWS